MVRPSCRAVRPHEPSGSAGHSSPLVVAVVAVGGVGRRAVDGRPGRPGRPSRLADAAWPPQSDPPRAVRSDPSARPIPRPRRADAASRQPAPTARAPEPPPPRVNRPSRPDRRRGTARPSATPLLRAALDARLERLRAKYGIPGISAAILFADGSIWRGAAGLADVADRRQVTADTAFAVASVSKTFTAALILALVEDGRLDLDAIGRARTCRRCAIDPAITVRQLLDHTSGLRDFYFHPRHRQGAAQPAGAASGTRRGR